MIGKRPRVRSKDDRASRIDIYETEVMVCTLRENGIVVPYIKVPGDGYGARKLSIGFFTIDGKRSLLSRFPALTINLKPMRE